MVEILSTSTRQKDLLAKRDLYAATGVPRYLILDPESNSATMLELVGGEYRPVDPEEAFELHPQCRIELSVSRIFR